MIVRHAFTVAALIGLVGCVSPYTVREQRNPNPFAGRETSFAVLPLDFSKAYVDMGPPTNVDWNDDDRAEFEQAKRVMKASFQHAVLSSLHEGGIAAEPASATAANQAAFFIQPEVLEILPGDFSGGVGRPATHVRIGVAIVDRGGHVVDIVEVEHGTANDPLAGDLDRRFYVDGSTAAERLAGYLHERVTPGSELR